jgi:hypothetical protein
MEDSPLTFKADSDLTTLLAFLALNKAFKTDKCNKGGLFLILRIKSEQLTALVDIFST